MLIYSYTNRVETWLQHATKFSTGVGSSTGSICPQSVYVDDKETSRGISRSGSRSTHTAAGSTSPGTIRLESFKIYIIEIKKVDLFTPFMIFYYTRVK